MRRSKKADVAPDTVLPPVEPLIDDKNLIILSDDRRELFRIKGDPRFRITFQGQVYEHCGQDAKGRWLYAPMT